jgi:hypothetical protein
MNQPCKECPFRKKSFPGYLGEASGDPQRFLLTLETKPIPCHMQVDWEGTDAEYADALAWTKPCLGSLQFLKNTCKLPWDKKYAAMRNEAERNPEVFEIRTDFIKHHDV